MTFLQSLFLYGVFASSIPLLIHFFSRRKKVRIPFSSLYFLKKLEKSRIRSLKLRKILLLITRMLICILLALIFARPALKGASSTVGADGSPVAALILIDKSLSVSADHHGSSVFEYIKQAAEAVLSTLGDGDEISFLFSDRLNDLVGPFNEVESAQRILRSSETSFGRADLTQLVNRGIEALSGMPHLHKELYLISDMQRTNFNPEIEKVLGDESIRLYFVNPVADKIQNIGVLSLEVQSQILEPGKEFGVLTVIKNYGENRDGSILVSLYYDGVRSAQKELALDAGETGILDFVVIPERTGEIDGMIVIEDDPLIEDNKRYFSTVIPAKINVLVVTGNVASPFLSSALLPGLAAPLSFTEVDYAGWKSVAPEDFDLIVLNGLSQYIESDLVRLQSYFESSKGVIILPDKAVDPVRFNDLFANKLGLPRFSGILGEVLAKPGQSFVSMDKIDFEHQLFDGMFLNEAGGVEYPEVYKTVLTELSAADNSIIKLANGASFLIETAVGSSKALLFTSSIDPDWSTLPFKGIFVPLMYRVMRYASLKSESNSNDILVDGQIELSYEGEIDVLEVLTPEGETVILEPKINARTYRALFEMTTSPGIYRFTGKGEDARKIPVNVDPVESDNQSVSVDDARAAFGKILSGYWTGEERLAELILEERTGKEITSWFIYLLLFFLIIETALQLERSIINEEEEPLAA